ncbi:MAG: cytochrome C oxidase subunit IV family protein [Rhodobacteraceae bacterium]|jgi:cytochrome o ubiquinol oxidase operon protein cyoD|nr:cytochrome C oxidase subunit IV family protein [Paracoccaceae bacterium]
MIPPYLQRPKLSDYAYGFILAVLLTVIPFGLVAYGDMEKVPALILIAALAALQLGVQLRYFMHFSTHRTPAEARWALGLALLMGGIFLGGCLWVMIDLNHRMMPGMMGTGMGH